MQVNMKQTKKKNGRGVVTVLISVLLALLLGASGYFGVTMLLTGRSPLDMFGGNFTPKSNLPTDSDGNNLGGNSMQNLYAGGLMAMQGKDVFYANPADGGSLYCRDRNGKITKLTDFAVANLNVSGERLIFTDLDACSLTRENGETVLLSADTHEALWNEASESDHIRYGGHLYFIIGIKSFCAGDLSYEELTIVGLESDDRYQAPILMENGDLLLIVASPDSGVAPIIANLDITSTITPLSAGRSGFTPRPMAAYGADFTPDSVMIVGADGIPNWVNLDTSKDGVIHNATRAGGQVFLETVNMANPSRLNTIIMLDPVTGDPLGSIDGKSMHSDGKNVYFINKDIIFKYTPETKTITQVSHTPCNSKEYDLRPDGTVGYQSRDPMKDQMVPMLAIPDENGAYTPNRDVGEWSFEIEKRKAVLFGDSYYGWSTTQKCWNRVDNYWWSKNSNGGTNLRDRSSTAMPWSSELRDRGPNALQWMPFSKLGELIASDNKREDKESVEIPASKDESGNKQYYNEDDMARSLTAITRMTQGYSLYEHGQIEHGYDPVEYAAVKNYYVDTYGDDFSLDDYISRTTDTIMNELGFDGSYESEVREAVKFWVKRFEFAVGECMIDNSAAGVSEEGRAKMVILERVHITSENFSTAIATAMHNYPGGLNALAARDDDDFSQWAQEQAIKVIKDPFGSGCKDDTNEAVIIMMYLDPELGWMPENLDHIRSNFIVIDPNIEFLKSALEDGFTSNVQPSSGGALEGVWQRVGFPEEQIFFRGNQITWTFGGLSGKIILAGAFEINGNELSVDAGEQGATSFDFSQNGDEITIENWTYERQ